MQQSGIHARMLDDPDIRIPMEAAVDFIGRAVKETGDANLGFHLAQHAEIGSFDVFFYLMATSRTVGDAYTRLSRAQRLIHDSTVVELTKEGSAAILRHRMPGGLPAPRHSAEFIVTAWVRAGRLAADTNWSPAAVHFAHASPAGTPEYDNYFGCPVQFASGQNALILPLAVLDMPCKGSDPALLAVLDRYVIDRLARAPSGANVADRVRTAVLNALKAGEPTASGIAQQLKMSVRTLHRLLAAEGTTYRVVLDHLRKEMAADYLGNNRIAITEVAFLLGFSELSAFYRAFQRWNGCTPADFRRRLR
jgi:AraC-like DNA-binding protein